MKRLLTLGLFSILSLAVFAQCADDRYTTELFTDIEEFLDVPYGSSIEVDGDVKELVFDFYAPANDDLEERPLIIWAHGGTFIAGDEDLMAPTCKYYASLGYANATINYRLAELAFESLQVFDNDITVMMADELIKSTQDMRAAIRFFRKDYAENNNQYGIDTDQIFIGGVSAGGICAVHLAYLSDMEGGENIGIDLATLIEANGGLEGESGNPGYPSNVNGVVSFSGAIADVSWIQADEPPLVSVHETGDGTVPYESGIVSVGALEVIEMQGSKVIHDHAEVIGLQNNLLTFEDDLHVGYLFNDNLEPAYEHVKDFLAELVVCPTAATSGIEELPYEFSVYPTIAADFVNLNLASSNEVEVSVMDINGRVLQRENISNNAKIEFENLASGFYFLNVRDGSTQSTKKFLIK